MHTITRATVVFLVSIVAAGCTIGPNYKRPPSGAPDAFRGQVLSLHPLSGFFMMDPALRAVAGNFFGPDAAWQGAAGAPAGGRRRRSPWIWRIFF